MKPITIKVRTVSFKLWRQARIKAVERDIRMRVVINEALALWLRKGGEVMPKCETCGLSKQPIGRDAAARGPDYCDHECEGYMKDPHPGYLWPSEIEGS